MAVDARAIRSRAEDSAYALNRRLNSRTKLFPALLCGIWNSFFPNVVSHCRLQLRLGRRTDHPTHPKQMRVLQMVVKWQMSKNSQCLCSGACPRCQRTGQCLHSRACPRCQRTGQCLRSRACPRLYDCKEQVNVLLRSRASRDVKEQYFLVNVDTVQCMSNYYTKKLDVVLIKSRPRPT